MADSLSLEDFGRQLVETQDLDPIYVALQGAKLPTPQLRRWLFAYWCSYHAGVASYMSEREGSQYWLRMIDFAANTFPTTPFGTRWPRGRERRHFRGQKCVDAINWFVRTYIDAEHIVSSIEIPGPYRNIQKKVTQWPMFGPWIAFKIGDMLERVMGVEIDFRDSDVFFFDSPRDAAETWMLEHKGAGSGKNAVVEAVQVLQGTLGHLSAPPNNNRPLGIQEFETILCKFGSHRKGHYPIGIDSRELREALHPWTTISETAAKMLAAVPDAG